MKRSSLDLKVRPNHLVEPDFPKWVTGILHPELTRRQQVQFALANLEMWHPAGSKRRQLRTGYWLYRQLKKADLLDRCLGFSDLLQIKHHGIPFYKRHFGEGAVFGWKSVVRDRLGFLYVPYLFEFGDGLYVHWYFLEFAWQRITAWIVNGVGPTIDHSKIARRHKTAGRESTR